MKNRLNIILGLFIFCFGSIFGQENSLYLIAGQGCPGNCNDEYSQHYPVHLLKLKKDTLQKISDLAIGDEFVFKIAKYDNFKKAIVYKSGLLNYKKSIIIIDYSNKLKIDTFEHTFPSEAFFDFTFYAIDAGKPYIVIKYYPNFNDKRDSVYYYGINLNTRKDTLFDNNIIKYLHSEGEQGIVMVEGTSEYSEIMKIRTSISNNKLIKQIIYPRCNTKDTCMILLPNFEQLSKNFEYVLTPDKLDQFMVYPIFEQSTICLYTSSHWDGTMLKGLHNYQIYDKHDNLWKNKVFKGLFESGIHQYGDWLSGYVAYSYQRGFQQKMKKYGSIPGVKYRQKASIYGSTFDERAKEYQLYPEGILYLYNLKTLKYIEWEALENGERQGNSEILLVQDEIVYYRINDMIYKAPILNGEALGTPVLLVKDPRIPDIHWAFISGN